MFDVKCMNVFLLTLTMTGNCRVIDSFRTRGVAENIPTCKEIILVPGCVDAVENSLLYIDGILITTTVKHTYCTHRAHRMFRSESS